MSLALAFPERLDLARLPTPLERLRVERHAAGLDLWIKRDDLTGAALTGNKVRKLEFLAAAAQAAEADTLVTCGAVNSNHARATAVVAARLGMRSHLLLRGDKPKELTGNLLLDRLLGASVTFIPPSTWPERDARMAEIASRLRAKGRRPYVVPEGGSNAIGSLGYARMVDELLTQERAGDLRIRRIVHACGSGGTTAGLALGIAASGREDLEVIGVAVCDDRTYFDEKVGAICDEAVEAGFVPPAVREGTRWRILEGYKGRGYGKTTPEEMTFLAGWARREGLLFDPVYTGKALRGLLEEAKAGRLEADGATVFVHTGGVFGLFAYPGEIASLDGGETRGSGRIE